MAGQSLHWGHSQKDRLFLGAGSLTTFQLPKRAVLGFWVEVRLGDHATGLFQRMRRPNHD